MKKFLWLLLLLPLSINARANINSSIECQEELTIGNYINCKLILDNPSKLEIKDVSFEKNNSLLDLKTGYELNLEENTYVIPIDSDENKITVITFNYLMEKNNSSIVINDFKINTSLETIDETVSKNLAVKDAAYVDKIYINNIPITDMNRDTYTYAVTIYERTEYIELKIITSGKNKVIDGDTKLIKYSPSISFKVANESDTETYNINLNYSNPSNARNIDIKEIPFKFNPNKKYYYLEVENNVYKLHIENGITEKECILNVGKNNVNFDNDGDIYNFVINRLKTNEKINEDSKLKTLKIGNTYLNLKDDVFEYNHIANNVEIVTVETSKNQDYEIKYSNNKIKIIVYDAKLDSTEYTINLVDDTVPKKDIKEYDNSKSIVIFLIFLLSFILILLAMIRKHKKERID